jgi:ubiquinone/menaquinone biosynthesis C-methylase UbiE
VLESAVRILDGLLVCPECGRRLRADGVFSCPVHGKIAQLGGFPSFVVGCDEAFEDHWERNASPHLAPDKFVRAEAFLAPALTRFAADRPITILDAGCGEGAHISVLSRLRAASRGDRGIGVDIALSALRSAAPHAGPGWALLHADMMCLPLAEAKFDLVFSFGVLALTPEPRRALAEMTRVLRPGGLLGFWVFPGANPVIRDGLRLLRGLSRALGPGGATLLGNILVPFYGLLPTRSGISLSRASWRQTREVIMSNLTPPYLHFLSEQDLRSWLAESGVEVIGEGDGVPTTLWGVKQ